MLTLGDARLTMVNGGNFRLDGGAMHGVVPKTLWSKLVSCDDLNRCEYTTRCLLVEGETEIAPGVRVLPTPGHTAGHQSVLLGPADGPKALFLGDVVPTAVHVKLPWVMSYDLEPARTVETKRALFTRAVTEDWLVIWGHDKDHAAGRLGVDKDGGFVVRELTTI